MRVFTTNIESAIPNLVSATDKARGFTPPGLLKTGHVDDARCRLLDLDGRTSGFEIFLHLLGFFLRRAFLQRSGGFDEILRFLQAETRDGADSLNDFDLLLTGSLQDDVEFGLFFNRS